MISREYVPLQPIFITDITSDYEYKATFENTVVKYHNKIKDTPEHKIEFIGGASISFMINANAGTLKAVYDSKLEYGDISYEILPDEIKEVYLIKERPPRDYIEYLVITEGDIYYNITDDGRVIVTYDDINGEGLDNIGCILSGVFLVDANNDRYDNVSVDKSTVKIGNITYDTLIYSVDSTWLDNAAYPVVVDPSTLIQSRSGTNYYMLTNMLNLRQCIRADNGNMIASWHERSPSYAIKTAIGSVDDFASPSYVTIATSSSYIDYQSFVKLDNGDLLVAFREVGIYRKLQVYRSQNNGTSWSSLSTVADSSSSGTWNLNGLDMIKSPNGYIWLIAEDVNISHVWKSENSGSSWSQLTSTGLWNWYPAVTYDFYNDVVWTATSSNNTTGIRLGYWSMVGSYTSMGIIPTSGYSGTPTRVLITSLNIEKNGDIHIMAAPLISGSYIPYIHTLPRGSTGPSATTTALGQGSWGTARMDRNDNLHYLAKDSSSNNNLQYRLNSGSWAVMSHNSNLINYAGMIHITPKWDQDDGKEGHVFGEWRPGTGNYEYAIVEDEIFTHAKLGMPSFFGM